MVLVPLVGDCKKYNYKYHIENTILGFRYSDFYFILTYMYVHNYWYLWYNTIFNAIIAMREICRRSIQYWHRVVRHIYSFQCHKLTRNIWSTSVDVDTCFPGKPHFAKQTESVFKWTSATRQPYETSTLYDLFYFALVLSFKDKIITTFLKDVYLVNFNLPCLCCHR